MHWLAPKYRSEFLATPQLVRFEYAEGPNGREPTLLVKGKTLLLKYIVQGVALQLCFSWLGKRLLYALKVSDDDSRPAVLWSVLESDEEKAALLAFAEEDLCQIHLFNELVVNVAWAPSLTGFMQDLKAMAGQAITGSVDHQALKSQVTEILDQIHNEKTSATNFLVVDLPNAETWNAVSNQFITAQAASSPIDLFHHDEGRQQEQLALWLTDSLDPLGAYPSPQIPKGKSSRELTDVLLSHKYGAILIESKTFSILERKNLPGRTKLARDVVGHINKAVAQLKGGIRQIRRGTTVTTTSGSTIDVEREQPAHGIILIPDLGLVTDRTAFGAPMIRDFMKSAGSFIHILDVAELLRVVQAAEIIYSRGKTVTLMMAFDYYLIERAKKAYEVDTLCIEVLLRTSDK